VTEPELLRVDELRKSYRLRRSAALNGHLAAVDGVSFSIGQTETLGLVGESGSGKTTTGRLILRLEDPDSGRIRFQGEDWLALEGGDLRRRRRDMQVVFQDPQTSLNPRMRVGAQVAEPLRVQRLASRSELPSRVERLLASVGLSPDAAERFPAELSGGQRQRVAIARALATGPRLLVCDEPVSALDVSIAAQILNLLIDLRREKGLAMLFISHDLSVVRRLADRIAVMYRGRIVEEGPAAALVERPLHPYTAALLSAVADRGGGPGARARIVLPPEPSEARAEEECPFAARCPIAKDHCRAEAPSLVELEPGRRASCFYPGELAP
jgi:oligopeptide/dipeptide ABC transporter ATP-binding protein